MPQGRKTADQQYFVCVSVCAGSAQPCAWNCGKGLSQPASLGRGAGEIRRKGQALTSPLRRAWHPVVFTSIIYLNPHKGPEGQRLSYLLVVEEEAGPDCCSNSSKVTQQGRGKFCFRTQLRLLLEPGYLVPSAPAWCQIRIPDSLVVVRVNEFKPAESLAW